MIKVNYSTDLYIFSHDQFKAISTISELVWYNGGDLFYYEKNEEEKGNIKSIKIL